jgi:trigger factor
VKVTTERAPDSQVVLEIEVEPERVERSLDQAYRRLANRARIPGFRPGKAPRQLIERTLGHEALMQEALDKLVPEVYKEAVAESDIDPIAVPDLEVKTLDPVVIKATVPVRPTVDLGDYRAIRVEREPVEVSDEAIDAEVEVWRRRMATWEPVERGVAKGDLVRADVEMSVDDRPLIKQDDAEFLVRDELEAALPGIMSGLEGMQRDESKSFTTSLPDDFRDPALRGLEAVHTVAIKEIKEQKLPELDEDFARSAGEGFDSVVAFREWVAEGLRRQAEEAEAGRLQQAALDALVEAASMEYPQVLVDHEVTHLLRDRVGGNGDGRAMEQFLAQIGKSEDEVRDELTPVAVERVKRSLVMDAFAKHEAVGVEDEEVEAEIDRVARDSEQLRTAFSSGALRDQLSHSLRTRKTLERLAEITASDPGDGAKAAARKDEPKAPAEAEAPAAPKPARSRKKTSTGDSE